MKTQEQEKQAQKVLELFKGETLSEIKKVLRLTIELAENKATLS